MKSILGMVTIEQGSIKYQGQELVGKKSHEIVPMGISLVPEGRKIFVEVSVEKNLEIGTLFRKREKSRDKELLDMVYQVFPRLYERRTQLGGTLSGGEQQMLAVGRAIMSDPQLLMLDEPSMGRPHWWWRKCFASFRRSTTWGSRSFWWNRMPRWPSRSVTAPIC